MNHTGHAAVGAWWVSRGAAWVAAAVGVVALLGWVANLPRTPPAARVALFTAAGVLVCLSLIWVGAALLQRLEGRRLEAERALRETEAFYHTLVENLPQKVFQKDVEGHFMFGNQRLCAEFGRPIEELRDKTDFDFFPRELAERYRRDDMEVMRTGQTFEKVEEHVTPDGTKQYVQVAKFPVRDRTGRTIGIQGIYWDVSERKRFEEQIQAKNRELEQAVESERRALEALKQAQSKMVHAEKMAGLGQMVAGVAHEINNPLAFVSNNVAVLQRDVRMLRELVTLYGEGDEVLRAQSPGLWGRLEELKERADVAYTLGNLDEVLGRSREGLKRIQQIVKDLREFARLDEGDVKETDLNAGIESTVNIVRGLGKKKRVELKTELQPLPAVVCNPAKINQVVMNLLSNAVDASPDGGEVVVRSAAGDGQVSIEVADQGRGIEPAVLERIFDPFFTTKPPGEGTGLGLSISYGIVRDHGGRIEVDSTPGQGARFTVHLPTRAGHLVRAAS